jgi:hypothetical protein
LSFKHQNPLGSLDALSGAHLDTKGEKKLVSGVAHRRGVVAMVKWQRVAPLVDSVRHGQSIELHLIEKGLQDLRKVRDGVVSEAVDGAP